MPTSASPHRTLRSHGELQNRNSQAKGCPAGAWPAQIYTLRDIIGYDAGNDDGRSKIPSMAIGGERLQNPFGER
jgi:hypothetical protein